MIARQALDKGGDLAGGFANFAALVEDNIVVMAREAQFLTGTLQAPVQFGRIHFLAFADACDQLLGPFRVLED